MKLGFQLAFSIILYNKHHLYKFFYLGSEDALFISFFTKVTIPVWYGKF